MSERKVLNKYFPPDFDPSKVPEGRQGRPGPFTYKVRLMAPFSMRCNMCKEYVYKGKKFNAKKETVRNEDYLGIEIFRFYIRCPTCSNEITFKTDPKNADYICEHGASRNFESWREEKDAEEEMSYRKILEEKLDPMKALENKVVDSKREIDVLDALDELRTRNALAERVHDDEVLDAIHRRKDPEEEVHKERLRREQEEDEALARSVFRSTTEDGVAIKRLLVEDEEEAVHKAEAVLDEQASAFGGSLASGSVAKRRRPDAEEGSWNETSAPKKDLAKSLGIVVKKAKPSTVRSNSECNNSGSDKNNNRGSTNAQPTTSTNALAALVGAYGDSDGSNSD